jgi:death-on-curing protein
VEIRFLSLDEVIEIHQEMIDRYGGSGGIRDQGLLESAVASPQAGFGGQYLHVDVFEMAAAYLFNITMNHPFIDGNKRTGATAAFVFLKLNNLTLTAGENQFELIVRTVAEGKLGKDEIAKFFQKNSKRSR